MDRDARKMRGDKQFIFTNLKQMNGVREIADFIIEMGGIEPDRPVLLLRANNEVWENTAGSLIDDIFTQLPPFHQKPTSNLM